MKSMIFSLKFLFITKAWCQNKIYCSSKWYSWVEHTGRRIASWPPAVVRYVDFKSQKVDFLTIEYFSFFTFGEVKGREKKVPRMCCCIKWVLRITVNSSDTLYVPRTFYSQRYDLSKNSFFDFLLCEKDHFLILKKISSSCSELYTYKYTSL